MTDTEAEFSTAKRLQAAESAGSGIPRTSLSAFYWSIL